MGVFWGSEIDGPAHPLGPAPRVGEIRAEWGEIVVREVAVPIAGASGAARTRTYRE